MLLMFLTCPAKVKVFLNLIKYDKLKSYTGGTDLHAVYLTRLRRSALFPVHDWKVGGWAPELVHMFWK